MRKISVIDVSRSVLLSSKYLKA